MEKAKPLFEHVTCTRCGGSGNFSFNLMHGSRCYGCGGDGYQLTKRGKAAQNYLNSLRKVAASDLNVGDLIWFDLFDVKCCERITSIETDSRGAIFVKATRTKTGESICISAWPMQTVDRGLTNEQRKEAREKALAYQATLTKAGVPSKRKTKEQP